MALNGDNLGDKVRTFYMSDRSTRSEGEVVGYCPAPMVCVRNPDGTEEWWRADLAETIPPTP